MVENMPLEFASIVASNPMDYERDAVKAAAVALACALDHKRAGRCLTYLDMLEAAARRAS